MTQSSYCARLSLEARYSIFILCEFRGQYFESHPAAQAAILRQVKHSHTTGAELRQYLILCYRLPNHVAEDPVRHVMVGRVRDQVNMRHLLMRHLLSHCDCARRTGFPELGLRSPSASVQA